MGHHGRTKRAQDIVRAGAEAQRGRPLNSVVRQRMQRLFEIQALAFAGFVAGVILWPRVLEWPLVVLEARKARPGQSLRSMFVTLLLHSGPWVLLLIGWCTYHLLALYSDQRVAWFLGSFYICLVLMGALVAHLSRVIGAGGRTSPILWLARAMRRKRNFFLYSYITSAAICLPYVFAFYEPRGFMLFVLVVWAFATYFLAWYMWQFREPDLEAPAENKK